MNKFMLSITASSGEFYQGDCEDLTLPISDGIYGVQAGHNTHEFDELVGEKHHLEAHEEVHPAVRRELEAVGDVREAHRGTRHCAVHALDMRGRVAEADD